MEGRVEYLYPEGIFQSPAYTPAVVVSGNVKTIYVGGTNAVDASGQIIGKGDLAAQTEQVLKNIETILAAAGARPEHVVKWTVYVVQGQSARAGFEAFLRWWGNRGKPPALTVAFVAGLADPNFLVEIEAIAVVPQP